MSITLGTDSEYVFQNPQLKCYCGAHNQTNHQKIQGKFETEHEINTLGSCHSYTCHQEKATRFRKHLQRTTK